MSEDTAINLNSKIVPVYFSCDENYVPQLCVAIASIVYNTSANLHFIVLAESLSDAAKANILKVCAGHKLSIETISKYGKYFENVGVKQQHISIATCYRFFIPLLDFDYEKGIYLDCDVVVLGDVAELLDFDLGDNYLAGTNDFISEKYIKSLTLDKYFNAGVLLLNLKKFRQDNVFEKLISELCDTSKHFKYLDQDILNIVLGEKSKLLPTKWGAVAPLFRKNLTSKYESASEIKEAIYSPKIVHFTGPDKPWSIPRGITAHPWTPAYFYYMRKTPFASNVEKINASFNVIGKFINYWSRHLLFFVRPMFFKMRLLYLRNKRNYSK